MNPTIRRIRVSDELYVGFGCQMKRGFFSFILRPPKLVRMRVRVRIRVHVTGGVLARGLTYVGRLREQPHWRWPNQGAAVAKVALSALKSRRGAARQSAATSMAGFLMNFSSAAVEL